MGWITALLCGIYCLLLPLDVEYHANRATDGFGICGRFLPQFASRKTPIKLIGKIYEYLFCHDISFSLLNVAEESLSHKSAESRKKLKFY